MHQGKRQEVRQMADGRENPVMLAGRQFPDQAAAALPCRAYAGDVADAVFRQRRQHHLLLAIEIGARGQRTAVFGAGNRMRRNELPDALAEVRARGGDDVFLGTAGVGDHRLRSQAGAMRAMISAVLPTGVAISTRSASDTSWPTLKPARSTIPSSQRLRQRAQSVRPKPTTSRPARPP
jgi:hypothetical protein